MPIHEYTITDLFFHNAVIVLLLSAVRILNTYGEDTDKELLIYNSTVVATAVEPDRKKSSQGIMILMTKGHRERGSSVGKTFKRFNGPLTRDYKAPVSVRSTQTPRLFILLAKIYKNTVWIVWQILKEKGQYPFFDVIMSYFLLFSLYLSLSQFLSFNLKTFPSLPLYSVLFCWDHQESSLRSIVNANADREVNRRREKKVRNSSRTF